MRKYWFLLFIFIILSIYLKIIGEYNFPLNVLLFKIINYHQIALLNSFFVFFSKYGREYVWIPLTAILLIFKRTRRIAITLAASFILAIILGEASKIIMAQLRPFYYIHADLLVPPPHDYSYPSGHALIVGDGAMVLYKTSPRWLWIPFFIEALIVSYSRVYVGVHWPIDILGGWLLGSWIAYFTVDMESKGILRPIEKLFKVS
ncbi:MULTISPECIES: undecaprenyl-diphosphatase SepP [Sulfurisphaera]|uniref:Dolicholpyrophosphatase n=2 Tax=Sulfurisphaera tokodaii TaxID=111955 RepID=F9VPB8_SULTO|nr:phosphatase PAP2 family protein [Sulfurisphaera tokodaii]BAK54765.1 dolicholpyrophosphatase [Sulfurisphaera tokodaii str. 7]HII73038.1 phosphatase PAP2 family protein [Sulfurisphaera tokodaii]